MNAKNTYGSEGEFIFGRQPVEQPGNGYAALRRDVDGLLKWKDAVQFSGCPHHADMKGDIDDMKKAGSWMIGLQIVTLLGIVGTLAVMLWRATGHAG